MAPPPQSQWRRPYYTASRALQGPNFRLGTVLGMGATAHAPNDPDFSPLYTGISYSERDGLITAGIMFAVFNTLGFVVPAAALRTHTHTTVVRHRSPTDPSVIILDSTTTTTVTQEDWDEYERQFHARETAGVDEFAMAGAGFELDVYTRGAFGHALGDARGYHVALTMPVLNKPGIMIETGFYRDQILTIDSSTQRAWHAIAGGPTGGAARHLRWGHQPA